MDEPRDLTQHLLRSSPDALIVIDAGGRIVGLLFDGNIHSISGAYWFDDEKNRAVAVHPADPDTAWFVPGISDEHRIPPRGKVVVSRTRFALSCV